MKSDEKIIVVIRRVGLVSMGFFGNGFKSRIR